MRVAIVDALAYGSAGRIATVDVIGSGPRAVAGVLESLGVDYVITQPDRLEIPVGVDAVFISAMSSDIPTVRKVIEHVRRKRPKALIVVGGPAALSISDVLASGADIGVVGEGEKFVEVFTNLLSSIKDAREVLEEVAKLPNVYTREARKGLNEVVGHWMTRDEMNRYRKSVSAIRFYPQLKFARVYVEVVRGCSNFRRPRIKLPGKLSCVGCGICFTGDLASRIKCPLNIPPGCGYCSVPSVFGPARTFYIKNIVEEVAGLIEAGVRRVVLSAPDFLDYGRDFLVDPKPLTDPRSPPPNLDAIEELFTKLYELPRVNRGEAVVMIENVKPNLVTEEAAKLLGRYLKGTTVHIGAETGNNKHLEMLGRPNTVEEVIKAVKLLKKYGMRPYVYFIHGLPGQNMKTARDTVKLMRKLARAGAEKITVYRFTPLPATAFEGFPRPKPAYADTASKLIVEEAKRLNKALKRQWLGREVEVVVGGVYHRMKDGRDYYATYPLRHGPVTLVPKTFEAEPGDVLLVKVRKVLSDRLLLADLVSKL